MVTATYNHYYGIPGSNISGSQAKIPHIAGHSITTTLSNTEDGSDDGTLAVGGHAVAGRDKRRQFVRLIRA